MSPKDVDQPEGAYVSPLSCLMRLPHRPKADDVETPINQAHECTHEGEECRKTGKRV